MPGKTDAECVRECMKHKGNWSYALLIGDKVYALAGDAKKVDSLAGQQVAVKGEVTADKIVARQLHLQSKFVLSHIAVVTRITARCEPMSENELWLDEIVFRSELVTPLLRALVLSGPAQRLFEAC